MTRGTQSGLLVSAFKSVSTVMIYVGSGKLCSDSQFVHSKTRVDGIGSHRRFCRELLHFLLEEDPMKEQHMYEEPDEHAKVSNFQTIDNEAIALARTPGIRVPCCGIWVAGGVRVYCAEAVVLVTSRLDGERTDRGLGS